MTSYKSSHVFFGKVGEQYVRDFLRELGLVIQPGEPGDLVTGSITIEVKASRPVTLNPRRDPGFQFCIQRWPDCPFRSDFLVLLCYSRKREVVATYVIPKSHVNGNHKIVIPTVAYKGKWAIWLDAWENILTHPEVEYGNTQSR